MDMIWKSILLYIWTRADKDEKVKEGDGKSNKGPKYRNRRKFSLDV